MQELSIPDGPEAMTPAWLTAALRASGVLTDAVVTAVTWQPLSAQGWTTRMARLALTYHTPLAGLPATLVAKSAAQDAHTRASFGRFYACEVAFYQWVIVIGQELGQTHHFKRMPGRLEDAAVHQRLVSKKRRTRVLGAVLAFNFPLQVVGLRRVWSVSFDREPSPERPSD